MRNIKENVEANIKEEYKGYILNLETCTYINSSAFEYLVELYKRLKSAKKRLILCSMVPDVYQLFNITRLDKIIDICKNEKDAIKEMNSN
jgi:anti-sigma B factor antagonist